MNASPSQERPDAKQEAEGALSKVCSSLAELFPQDHLVKEHWPVSIEPPPGPGRRSGPRKALIRVLPEDLQRPRQELLVVLLHGMVHCANALGGIHDCSRGHYHNRRFLDRAKQVGLRVTCTDRRFGWVGAELEASLVEYLRAIEVPPLPQLSIAAPGPLKDRYWGCGPNLPDKPGGLDWRTDLALPKLPRFRIGLIQEQGIPVQRYPVVDTLQGACQLCWRLLGQYEREAVAVLFLDNRRRLIGYDVPYIGSLEHTGAEPRGIFLPALMVNAAGVVVAHNHPSGDPTPSELDYRLTRRLTTAGEILGLSLFASLVVAGPDSWREVRIDNRLPPGGLP